ncbi:hypothetical protein GCM10027280_07060 [Micromonospora polyrhachis]|uniref:Knr4/Smi1-like domain-containing protein n=1 Tax=Micromonospora polyrhachis TaxID=1282883 RepID=A0A7W7SLG8_9ACTN|nr:DUF6406 domain-containing protein [Micromonospora polyrhachis]MBB4956382.1 hypothetical protein [Micromonospora polyrhachis]
MRSFTNVEVIPNNVPVDLGPARLGVGWVAPGPPVSAEIIVMPTSGPDSYDVVVNLSETFPVGEEVWRFADVNFDNANQWQVTVRRVDADEPQDPPRGYVWDPARLNPYGRLGEEQLASVEAALGQDLPPRYRRWLARNNGASPAVEHHGAGLPFRLLPETPLLGVHPRHPAIDLVAAQELHRDRWLSREYLVIAVPSGGLLAVKVNHPYGDAVWFLPEDDRWAPTASAGAADREQRLVYLAQDISHFIGRMQPVPAAPSEKIAASDSTDLNWWEQP